MTGFLDGQYFWAVVILLAVIFAMGFGLGWKLAKNRHDLNIKLMTKLSRLNHEQRQKDWRY